MTDMKTTTLHSQQLREFVFVCVCPCPVCLFQNGTESYILAYRDTEYYDYGHGEAQETTYEGYSK